MIVAPTGHEQLSEVQLANVKYHSLLAQHYHEQPFFSRENLDRVRELLVGIRGQATGGRLLDVGCGTGFIFDLAYDLFDELEGIDITPEMLVRITPRPNVHAQVAPAEAIPFVADSFDVVTCYGVLHHLEDPGRFFREARRVLKRGGILFADEFPSPDFREMLVGTDHDVLSSDMLRTEWSKVVDDAVRYRSFGIEVEETKAAMAQCYGKRLLGEETLKGALGDAGFEHVEIGYRWFLAQGTIQRDRGMAVADAIDSYLRLLLPLSRRLFKYMFLIAS